MYCIRGSGFGLYGYLPALLAHQTEDVVLPERYRAALRARPELAWALPRVRWAPDDAACASLADSIVLATSPVRQCGIAPGHAGNPRLRRMVLEKTLAPAPAPARELLATLAAQRKSFRIGYTLLHTRWARSLEWPAVADANGSVTIEWRFMADHFRRDLHSWKRLHSQGGGALRFYGIHVLALLARAGYASVQESSLPGRIADQPDRWTALIAGPRLPDCRVVLDSRSDNRRFRIAFEVAGSSASNVDLPEPFHLEQSRDGTDRRTEPLRHLLESFAGDDLHYLHFCERVNALWAQAEELAARERATRPGGT